MHWIIAKNVEMKKSVLVACQIMLKLIICVMIKLEIVRNIMIMEIVLNARRDIILLKKKIDVKLYIKIALKLMMMEYA